jgi:hypothetical protein
MPAAKRLPSVIAYASNTGTKRNLNELRKYGWRVLLSPKNPTPRDGLFFAIDNGAWSCFQQKEPFDINGFNELVERHGGAADFVVMPDVVGEGKKSLRESEQWLKNRFTGVPKRLLLAVQDGMTVDEVGAFIRHNQVGIFLGGSTDWKLATMYEWGCVAHALNCYYHVGRVNSLKRIRLCAEAGADSFDGTSATMYSCNVRKLDSARKQPSLLTPRNHARP